MNQLTIEPLTAESFAPYGNVIETLGAHHYPINQGYAERFHDLARVDCLSYGGEVVVSLFRGQPRPLPIAIQLMERHPLGSQAFYPLQNRDWLVVVTDNVRDTGGFRAFRASGKQGVNYHRNIWHHPLLVLDANAEFLIIDRKGPGLNLEEVELAEPLFLDP